MKEKTDTPLTAPLNHQVSEATGYSDHLAPWNNLPADIQFVSNKMVAVLRSIQLWSGSSHSQ